jgi:hypothetical protein
MLLKKKSLKHISKNFAIFSYMFITSIIISYFVYLQQSKWINSHSFTELGTFADVGNRGQTFIAAISESSLRNFPVSSGDNSIYIGSKLNELNYLPGNIDQLNPLSLQGDDTGIYILGLIGKTVFNSNILGDLVKVVAILVFIICLIFQINFNSNRGKIPFFLSPLILLCIPLTMNITSLIIAPPENFWAPWNPIFITAFAPLLIIYLKTNNSKNQIMSFISLTLFGILLCIRQSILIYLILYLCIITFFYIYKYKNSSQLSLKILEILTIVLIIMFVKFLFSLILSKEFTTLYSDGHVFWHTVWCYFDVGNTKAPFLQSDYSANIRALQLNPNVIYGSKEYDAVLRTDVITYLLDNPFYIFYVIVYKIKLFKLFYILCIAFFLFSIVFIVKLKNRDFKYLFSSVAIYSTNIIGSLISSPGQYSYIFHNLVGFTIFLLLLIFILTLNLKTLYNCIPWRLNDKKFVNQE